jgi:hypothetical protein
VGPPRAPAPPAAAAPDPLLSPNASPCSINAVIVASFKSRKEPRMRTYIAGDSTSSCTVQSSTKLAMLSLRET